MTQIVFCNTPDNLQKALPPPGREVKYLLLSGRSRCGGIISFVESDSRFNPVELPTDFREKFQDKFVDFIAGINAANQSTFYWALNFTNKNPITTELCDRTADFLRIVDMLQTEDCETFLVITDDTAMVRQAEIHFRDEPGEIVDAISQQEDLRSLVRNFTPLAVLAAVDKAFWRVLLSGIFRRKLPPAGKKCTVVLSLLNEQSFTAEGNYRDAYFGDFVEYLRKQSLPFVNFLIVTSRRYGKMLEKLRRRESPPPAAMLENFLSIADLITCRFICLYRYFVPIRLKGPVEIDGIDLRHLVTQSIIRDYGSGRFFENLRVYYAIKAMSKKLTIEKFYYPFENRSFEKMALQALRKFSPRTRIIGYQHASLSLRHTNFLLAENEHKTTPLPDLVLTMGQASKNILAGVGRFEPDMLRVGCALRQQKYTGPVKPKKNISNILVVLATNIDEYVKVLKFLDQALRRDNPYKIWIRPHPVFDIRDAIKITGRPSFDYHKCDDVTLGECLDWAQAVLYVHSTISIEALARGIPAIQLDVPSVLDPDPLINFDDFKWRVSSPQKLPETIRAIDAMDESEFNRRQKLGTDYAASYFAPATEESLESFYNA